jgi:hypothetical protein
MRKLCEYLQGFGKKVDVSYWCEESEDRLGEFEERKVACEMFVWVVRCGTIGERDLHSNLGRVGSLLCHLLGLCHGVGLVDADLEEFVR